MANKEDLRIIRTKAALVDAFFALLEEYELEDISVNDLCQRAEIRRATFYKHFNDKTDFITYIIKDIRDTFDDEFSTETILHLPINYYIRYIDAITDFLIKREDAVTKILNSSMRYAFIEIFMQQNYIDTLKSLNKSKTNGMVISLPTEAVAGMLTGGITLNILNWFESRDKKTVKEMSAEVAQLIETLLK